MKIASRMLPIASVMVVTLFGCKFGSKQSNVKDDRSPIEVQTLTRDAFGFSWHRGASNSSAAYITDTIKAAEKNPQTSRFPEEARMGYGLYLANDPTQSMVYGDVLECVVLRSGTKVSRDERDLEIIRDNTNPVLIYPFLPGWYSASGDPAAVVRRSSVVDLERSLQLRVVHKWPPAALSPTQMAAANQALDSGQLCAALRPFEGNWNTFLALSATKQQHPWQFVFGLTNAAARGVKVPVLGNSNWDVLMRDAQVIKLMQALDTESLEGPYAKLFQVVESVVSSLAYGVELSKPLTLADAIKILSGVGLIAAESNPKDLKQMSELVQQQMKSQVRTILSGMNEEQAFFSKYVEALKRSSLIP